ncbi:hypothetical protein HPB50_027435 [Hyalomma asiaticum]|uniref:Uncharacterized protein n=1 Tax=Hyalomma asiaticum TaxID=266040 RepID=A0ACB7SLE4_HYAAI|nr:hypothetical protein HPB50_027435 [Hyalomma asiaticum]
MRKEKEKRAVSELLAVGPVFQLKSVALGEAFLTAGFSSHLRRRHPWRGDGSVGGGRGSWTFEPSSTGRRWNSSPERELTGFVKSKAPRRYAKVTRGLLLLAPRAP